MMHFRDTEITIQAGGHAIRVRVTADSLECWWGANVGPQDEAGLVSANMEVIEHIVADKLMDGDIGEDGVVVVSVDDYQG